MSNINQVCTKCGKSFLIIDQEQKFIMDKGLPLPNWCPTCRQERRMILRGPRHLFKAQCQKCQKAIITSYDPQTAKSIVLCKACYDQYFQETDMVINDPLPEIA